MIEKQDLVEKREEIEALLRYTFQNPELLFSAFVHRSYYNENREAITEHNERLEFLGDAVLGLIVSDYLFSQSPQLTEGELSIMRSHVVEAGACSRRILKLKLEGYVLLGKGERLNEGRGRETILADFFEAMIGAIYLDGGMEAAQTFFLCHFRTELEMAALEPLRNWKAELQDYSQKKYHKPPIYTVLKEEGPDHAKIFTVSVTIGDQALATGLGASKKQAEQAAAKIAIETLDLLRS